MFFQDRISTAIKMLSALIPRIITIPILQCIKVIQKENSITFEATNLENLMRVKLPIWTNVEGEYTVEAKSLLKLKNKVATRISKEQVCFGNVALPNHDVADFPSMFADAPKKTIWEGNSVDAKELITVGRMLNSYIEESVSSNPSLKGICFREGYFVATDGHRLFRYDSSLKIKKGLQFIIRPDFFRLLSNEFVIDDVIDLSVQKIGTNDEIIVATGMSFEIISKLVDGQYPSFDHILPKSLSHSFSADRRHFLSIIKEALNYANVRTSAIEITTPRYNTQFQIKAEDKENRVEFKDFMAVKNISNKKWDGVAINGKYLATILADCAGKYVELKTNESAESPIIIKSGDRRQSFILMPIRKNQPEEPSNSSENDKKVEAGKDVSTEKKQ